MSAGETSSSSFTSSGSSASGSPLPELSRDNASSSEAEEESDREDQRSVGGGNSSRNSSRSRSSSESDSSPPPSLTRQRNIPINYREEETDHEGDSMEEDDKEEVTADAGPEEPVDTIEKVMDIRQGKRGGKKLHSCFDRDVRRPEFGFISSDQNMFSFLNLITGIILRKLFAKYTQALTPPLGTLIPSTGVTVGEWLQIL
jgi:hypothetical protein